MVERINGHKTLKGLSALGASALFAAACGSADVRPSTAFTSATPDSTPIQTPDSATPRPTQIQVETPRPTEAQLSMEQQASNAVFNNWFSLLNKTQVNDGGPNVFYLKTEILNDDGWQGNLDKIKRGQTATDPIIADWVGGEVYYSDGSKKQASGIKSQGWLMITNPRLKTQASVGITNKQKSEGITWAGQTILQFDVTWAENQYWPSNGDLYTKPSIVKDWVLQKQPDELAQNSPISHSVITHNVIFKNGVFIDLDANKYADTAYPPLGDVQKPIFMMGDPAFCQNPDAVSSCQVFTFSSY